MTRSITIDGPGMGGPGSTRDDGGVAPSTPEVSAIKTDVGNVPGRSHNVATVGIETPLASTGNVADYVLPTGHPVQAYPMLGASEPMVQIGDSQFTLSQAIQHGLVKSRAEAAAMQADTLGEADKEKYLQDADNVEKLDPIAAEMEKQAQLDHTNALLANLPADIKANLLEHGTDISTEDGQRVHETVLSNAAVELQERGYDPDRLVDGINRAQTDDDMQAVYDDMAARVGENYANDFAQYNQATTHNTAVALGRAAGVDMQGDPAWHAFVNSNAGAVKQAATDLFRGSTGSTRALITQFKMRRGM